MTRGRKKATLTRCIGMLRLVSERDCNKAKAHLSVLKNVFEEFEFAHDKYVNSLTNDDMLNENEVYFSQAEESYISAVASATNWLYPSVNGERQGSNVRNENVENEILKNHMIDIMNKSRINIECFSGDPLHFSEFWSVFNQTYNSDAFDDQVRHMHLLQYCSGEAKSAIRHCALNRWFEGIYSGQRHID